jgi:uncharacterized protein
LKLTVLRNSLAIAKFSPTESIPPWAFESELFSVTRTSDELSLVVEEKVVPPTVQANRGWRALKINGPLEFTIVGVLHSVTQPLASAGISLFAISTFETDYVLVKIENVEKAIEALKACGHIIQT